MYCKSYYHHPLRLFSTAICLETFFKPILHESRNSDQFQHCQMWISGSRPPQIKANSSVWTRRGNAMFRLALLVTPPGHFQRWRSQSSKLEAVALLQVLIPVFFFPSCVTALWLSVIYNSLFFEFRIHEIKLDSGRRPEFRHHPKWVWSLVNHFRLLFLPGKYARHWKQTNVILSRTYWPQCSRLWRQMMFDVKQKQIESRKL